MQEAINNGDSEQAAARGGKGGRGRGGRRSGGGKVSFPSGGRRGGAIVVQDRQEATEISKQPSEAHLHTKGVGRGGRGGGADQSTMAESKQPHVPSESVQTENSTRGRGVRSGRGRGRGRDISTGRRDIDKSKQLQVIGAPEKAIDEGSKKNFKFQGFNEANGKKQQRRDQAEDDAKSQDQATKLEPSKEGGRVVKETKGKNDDNGRHSSAAKHAQLIPPNQPQQTNNINYGKGETITLLHVAEKPSIAQAIAKGLASSNISMRSKSLPVHEFTDPPFPKAPFAAKCNHRVTSVAGHVFSVDFPPQFQSWDSVDPAELFHAPIVRNP
jgi:hypothetical protein